MATIATVLVAAWAGFYVVSRRRARAGHPAAGRWNAGLLVIVLLLSSATCVAPVAWLVTGLGAVAHAPPAERDAVLQQLGGRAWLGLALGLVAIPLTAFGILQHARNRKRIREAKAEGGSRARSG
ncbi:MAG TPA: hypothetical protein VEB43_19045 [Anaeromyxobacter sp.]|nr:hypothetical protein [Anaeromyxobacter sp.]